MGSSRPEDLRSLTEKKHHAKIHLIYFTCGQHFESLLISLKTLRKLYFSHLGNIYLYIDRNDFLYDQHIKLLTALGLPLLIRPSDRITGWGEATVTAELRVFEEVRLEIQADDYVAKVDSDIVFVSSQIFEEVLASNQEVVGQLHNYLEPFIFFQGGCYFMKATVLPTLADFRPDLLPTVLKEMNNQTARRRGRLAEEFEIVSEDATIFCLVRTKTEKILLKNFYGTIEDLYTHRKFSVIHFEKARDLMEQFKGWEWIFTASQIVRKLGVWLRVVPRLYLTRLSRISLLIGRKAAALDMLSHFLKRLGSKSQRLYRWEFLTNYTYPMCLRFNVPSDQAVWQQVFGMLEYAPLRDIKNPRFIVDGGAYIGLSAVYFLNQFPQCYVLALEADEENFKVCEKNLWPYRSRCTVMHRAIWSHQEGLRVMRGRYRDKDLWTSQVQPATALEKKDVQGENLGELLQQSGFGVIDILKLDIEGAEATVFSAHYQGWLKKVRNMVIELHDEECVRIVHQALSNYRYDLVTLGDLTIFKNMSPV